MMGLSLCGKLMHEILQAAFYATAKIFQTLKTSTVFNSFYLALSNSSCKSTGFLFPFLISIDDFDETLEDDELLDIVGTGLTTSIVFFKIGIGGAGFFFLELIWDKGLASS